MELQLPALREAVTLTNGEGERRPVCGPYGRHERELQLREQEKGRWVKPTDFRVATIFSEEKLSQRLHGGEFYLTSRLLDPVW